MILLSARDLTRQFDAEPVFSGVTFDVRPGEKIGLVGPNGCGKTTLMHVLAGRDDPDVGRIEKHSSTTMALLEQQTAFDEGRTLIDEVKVGLAPLYRLQDEAHRLADRMAAVKDAAELDRLHRRYDEIHAELERLDAYHVDHRVDEVLQGLGFLQEDYDRALATFSGGQQNRALLGRLLLAAPSVLLLDEPTNHLDLETTEWLESYLKRADQAMIVVSHDRMFLDHVTEQTWELWRGGITFYTGGFSSYWQQREERLKVSRRTQEKQQDFIDKTQDFIARNKSGQKHAQAKDREKKLQRIERVDVIAEFGDIPMGFAAPSRTGDWVIRTEDISKGFAAACDATNEVPSTRNGILHPSDESDGQSTPTALFSGVTLQIDRGDRVGILGPNGSGKTTLLRTLIGELAPDTGQVRFGSGVSIGYFDQQLESVDPTLDAVEAIRSPAVRSSGRAPLAQGRGTDLSPGEARSLLARFGIRGDLALQQVGQMSGGERTKVALARIHALKPNLLILDEPTNHLDFWACAALETSVTNFDGTVLFVSHDRYFIDAVATKVVVLEPGGWRLHEGNYSDYQQFLQSRKQTSRGNASGATDATSGNSTRKSADPQPSAKDEIRRTRRFPYRKLDDIEGDIEREEQTLARIEAELADSEVHRDANRFRQVQQDYDASQKRLSQLMEHWEESAELN